MATCACSGPSRAWPLAACMPTSPSWTSTYQMQTRFVLFCAVTNMHVQVTVERDLIKALLIELTISPDKSDFYPIFISTRYHVTISRGRSTLSIYLYKYYRQHVCIYMNAIIKTAGICIARTSWFYLLRALMWLIRTSSPQYSVYYICKHLDIVRICSFGFQMSTLWASRRLNHPYCSQSQLHWGLFFRKILSEFIRFDMSSSAAINPLWAGMKNWKKR